MTCKFHKKNICSYLQIIISVTSRRLISCCHWIYQIRSFTDYFLTVVSVTRHQYCRKSHHCLYHYGDDSFPSLITLLPSSVTSSHALKFVHFVTQPLSYTPCTRSLDQKSQFFFVSLCHTMQPRF
jgi:hypothetical protein